jgi:hypothetical protein
MRGAERPEAQLFRPGGDEGKEKNGRFLNFHGLGLMQPDG